MWLADVFARLAKRIQHRAWIEIEVLARDSRGGE
jgi:hypothetical protein